MPYSSQLVDAITEGKEPAQKHHDIGTDTTNPEEVPSPKKTTPESQSPSPASTVLLSLPPNGGLLAWLQVAAGFAILFNTWGMISAFSVFQTYYESGELFVASSSNISWIGSIQSFLLQLTGLVAGPVYDRGYLCLLLVTGSFMVVFGLMMLSLCDKYWQALLAQAFCVGIGAGLLFVPTVSLLPTWFSTRMWLAIGIASSGSSLGGVIYPIVLLFYMSFYPADKRLTNPSLAFYIASIFNAGSVLGRILPNALSDKIGVFNTMAPLTVLLGVTMLCLLAVHNAAGMVVEAVVTGFFSGIVVALPPVCFRVLTKDPSMIGTRIGQGFAAAGIGLLIAGPSAGAILSTTEPLDWTGLWVYGGVTVIVGELILFAVRVLRAGFKLDVRA
ncbi:major facilitator superfamily domain-containing protein [Coniochaeta sp. 2T2.1]|nr:major facilitator superfamily domain-containing protein [Coniochaeta sp. 2T2.1]